MFVKPLAGRLKNAADQRARLTEASEAQTVASTNVDKSRKTSTANDEAGESIQEEDDDEENENLGVDDGIEEEFKQGSQQKFITSQEVKEHLERTWSKEGDLLNLMYGKYEPLSPGTPFETQSLGSQMFFLNKVVVPPTRFRPESEGAMGGDRDGGSGKAYLHTHSAMLLKILTTNFALKDALLEL